MSDEVAELLSFSVLIAVGFLFAVAFYESMCKRDVAVARTMRLARRVSPRPWVAGFAYVASVGVGIPILVIAWTVVLELALLVVGSVDRIGNIALISAAVVAATRILAYVREKTSHELAKAIPLSLAFLLLTGGATRLDENLAAIAADPARSDLTAEMLTFLIGLEIGLRLLTDGSNAALASIRRRRGIDSDLGIWRTAWSVIRRPLTPG